MGKRSRDSVKRSATKQRRNIIMFDDDLYCGQTEERNGKTRVGRRWQKRAMAKGNLLSCIGFALENT